MKKKAVYALSGGAFNDVYGAKQRHALRDMFEIEDVAYTREQLMAPGSPLGEAEVVFTGWGVPLMDAEFLEHAKSLRAVFHAAGSIRSFATPDFWRRGVVVVSAYGANAVPVAEFAEALVVLALKKAPQMSRDAHIARAWPQHAGWNVRGAYGARVGLVSLGMIGRLVAKRLKSHDLDLVAYDPFASQAALDADCPGVALAGLDEVFATSDVVSVHTPDLPETRGMISERLLSSMKQGTSFINTARGAVVDEAALVRTLAARSDLTAFLDVTFPEPPAEGSPLYSMANVFLTPHLAGSAGDECHRMAQMVVEEAERYLKGEPLRWSVTEERAKVMA